MTWQARRAGLLKTTGGRVLLWLLSIGYGGAVMARGLCYDLGLLRSRKAGAKVVCIGNLTTGGTGKTPATVLAAQTLRRSNHAVAILSRGYGRPQRSPAICVINDNSALDWQQCGDEPWMMHQILNGQGVPILVASDRVRAAAQAVTFFNSRVLILDDGFQHRRLQRDLDVVLVNAVDPFGGRRLLPMGNLREPLRALRRAGLIMLTHVDQVPDAVLAALREEIIRINPRAPLLEAVHRPDFLLEASTGRRFPLAHLAGSPVGTLSGLGAPEQFESCLERNGLTVAQRWRYPDHHRYDSAELGSISHLLGALPLITTYKDLVRFPPDWHQSLSGQVFVLSIKLDIIKGAEVWNETLQRLGGAAGSSPGSPAGVAEA